MLTSWKPLLALFIVATLFGSGWHIRAKLARMDALEAELSATKARLEGMAVSAQIAGEARTRNDERIPAVRKAVQDRVSLPDSATDAERLRDDGQAVAEYDSAASRLRGKGAK